MASFQAKIGQKSMTKIENKNYRFVLIRSYQTRSRKLKKKSKKIQKINKYHYGFILSQNRLGTDEKERIKIIVPFRSYPTRNRKFKKKRKKIQKIKRYHCGYVSS